MRLFFVLKIFFSLVLLSITGNVWAQNPFESTDTFFLAKEKGILGKLGRKLATDNIYHSGQVVNPYRRFAGKIIRNIVIATQGFSERADDTTAQPGLVLRVANSLHKNTKEGVIRSNLFFKEGEKVLPLLFSDNERYLRDQVYLQDAMIIIYNARSSPDSVDVMVWTSDIFSIGGSLRVNSTGRQILELKEENFAGSGSKISASMILDQERSPQAGFGAEYIMRNIRGNFVNWTTGFTTFNKTLNTGSYEERRYYTLLERLAAHRYSEWTGAVELGLYETQNAYNADSIYKSNFQYRYKVVDLWGGYNLGYRRLKLLDTDEKFRHIVSGRVFSSQFEKVPGIYDNTYNYQYADIKGLLFSYTLFRQEFHRINFIYGFGRIEDIPSGLSATFTTGWIDKQGNSRGYFGLNMESNHFSGKGNHNSFKFRTGGFLGHDGLEDISILTGIDHITKLRMSRGNWLNRSFLSAYIAATVHPLLNPPLFLNSDFGLPYFRNDSTASDVRGTIKLESVFFNLKKFLGFRFAPFVFTDFCVLKPIDAAFKNVNGYSAVGGGIRTRNENLVFGTIELRGYFFPRVTPEMQNWKVEIKTNLKFKYSSTFITKPQVEQAN